MKNLKSGTAVLVAAISLKCLAGPVFAQQTNLPKAAANPKTVATNFIADAVLSPAGIEQVLVLAKACGIDEPGKIETHHVLPVRGKAMWVKSVERIDGRNTTFDTLTISKKDWGGWVPGKDAKWVGDFWADADGRYSTLLRRYDFRKESIQIQVGKGVDTAVADKVVALIEVNDVRFGNGMKRRFFDTIKERRPKRLFLYPDNGGYCIEFEGEMRLMFEWKDDRILVTGVGISMA